MRGRCGDPDDAGHPVGPLAAGAAVRPTLDPATAAQADAVLALVRATLGDDLHSLVVHGSAVLGGLRPSSDLDLLAIADRPATEPERAALIASLLQLSGRLAAGGPARSIELTLVVLRDVCPWRYPPAMELQYGDWWRAELERGERPWASPNADLAVTLALVRERGIALSGPPPAEVLDPVPARDLEQAMVEGLPGLLADLETDARNVLLTLARIWTTLATGEIVAKDTAATWAASRLAPGPSATLEHARAMYLGTAADREDELAEGMRSCALALVEGIGAARVSRPG